jgi:hypothetical protein
VDGITRRLNMPNFKDFMIHTSYPKADVVVHPKRFIALTIPVDDAPSTRRNETPEDEADSPESTVTVPVNGNEASQGLPE